MATNLPAMPMRGGAQPSQMGMQDLVGASPDQPKQEGPSKEQKQQAVMGQVRKIHADIETLAREHPEAAQAARKATQALIEMMNTIVSSQRAPEPQSPKGFA